MLINTMEIKPGRLAEFRESVERAVRLAREHGPQLMVNVYIDEENMVAQSLQLYPDSDAILTHWELSDPYIQGVSENITPHLTGYARFPEAVAVRE